MRSILAFILSLLLVAPALAATPDEDVDHYLGIFQGDSRIHNMTVQDLGWKGISDTRLFDLLEQRVLSEQQAARASRAEKDRIAHYIRALGFSGQRKYRPTLSRFGLDADYMRTANLALGDLPQYERWNPVISARATFDPSLSDDANRVMNMLRSDDVLLQRIGAKRVYFSVKDDAVVAFLATRLKEEYPKPWQGEEADAIAWMTKALGHVAKDRYRSLLEEVMQGAPAYGVRKQAGSALKQNP
jgi:hypothetical protein